MSINNIKTINEIKKFFSILKKYTLSSTYPQIRETLL